MNGWVIDCYALVAAFCRSVLDMLRDTDRLHLSPLTWFPGRSAGIAGNYTSSISGACPARPAGRLSLVGGEASRLASTTTGLDARLREFHARGVIVLATDHECDSLLAASVESSWKAAGIMRRPTDETICAVMTAKRLGLSLVTEDSDARKLARHHGIRPLDVTELAASLAA